MQRLLLLMGCCVALAFLSERFSVREGIGRFRSKDRIFFLILSVFVIAFVGTRVDYNDTASYISAFQDSPKFPAVISKLDWALGKNPGFKIFTAIVRSITSDYHNYLMI